MKKFVGLSVVLILAGCGMSEGEKQQLASSTCNVISNAPGDDSTTRLKELNSAREQLGEAPYTGSDDDIRDSVKFGICEGLVLNDPTYQSLITQNREMVATEKKRIAGIAAVTCSVMGSTRNMDSAVRIRELNAARVEIGEDPYLDGDEVIKQSFEYGLCETLVAYPDEYPALLAEMKRLERERIAKWRRAEQLKEQERIQRVSGPLKEWKSAILARIKTVPNPIKDVKFRVFYGTTSLNVVYVCRGIQNLATRFIVTFSNDLGTLTALNLIGYCGTREIQSDPLSVNDTDRENLYKVIGDREEGSLLSSVKSIDVEIRGFSTRPPPIDRENPRSTFKYLDPKNFHEDLSESDLRSDPVKLRVYEK